ncbi:MAG: hypothetical protein AB1507_04385 [Bacillota bacterium]
MVRAYHLLLQHGRPSEAYNVCRFHPGNYRDAGRSSGSENHPPVHRGTAAQDRHPVAARLRGKNPARYRLGTANSLPSDPGGPVRLVAGEAGRRRKPVTALARRKPNHPELSRTIYKYRYQTLL